MTPSRIERKSTVGAALGFVLIGLAIAAVVVLMAMFPQVFESVVWIILVIVMALAVIVVGIALIMGLLALPMYAAKGVECQTDMSYDLDDVKDVKGSMEGKKE